MSDNSPANAHDEDHTGPIKTPKQLLQAVFLSFVLPIFIISIFALIDTVIYLTLSDEDFKRIYVE